jgi:hypothetical protein
MTFNHSHLNYKAPGTSGFYVSTVKDITQYYYFLLTINSLDRPAEETLLITCLSTFSLEGVTCHS